MTCYFGDGVKQGWELEAALNHGTSSRISRKSPKKFTWSIARKATTSSCDANVFDLPVRVDFELWHSHASHNTNRERIESISL